MNELKFIEDKKLRNKVSDRVDVLEKVKDLLLLKNTNAATTKQVADYYEVDDSVIKMMVLNNKDEFEEDGYKSISGKNIKEFLVSKDILPTNYRGYFMADGQKFAYKSNGLFTKRAILRAGMLLRDSPIAKEVRTRLLDVIHDTEEQSPEIIENITNEIDEEKQLMLQRVEAEMSGNYDEVSVINAKLFNLKNKRIKELETENQIIRDHSLTITDSRKVINRIVRSIGGKKYGKMYGNAWGELYSKLSYQLGINIKARKKVKGSYLNALTDEETYRTEEICRCWASGLGMDLDSLLKIA